MANQYGSTRLGTLIADARDDARRAVETLRAVLAEAGLALPSLGEDWQEGWFTGTVLVDLGRARPDVVRGIAELLGDGLAARAQQRS
ncbi:hypothetical protein OG455_30285 [Kitasatospora sp. NBC_01287]|uniref:hypothetical protein n=1 Tax=Kitasatospora sp. NBC_01287 TaxID=2903573 RepID=UPI00224CF2B5|nr:hypothetical protein [Kitasatospora sp. NBC_01287]MCX4749752.1 hypothetical protein [Kitasatospora sp. NBC_01287]